MVGAHCGDGGLTVLLPWNAKTRNSKPVWTISDPLESYLNAFKRTMGGGRVAKTGKSSKSRQYVLDGIKAHSKIVPLFEGKPLPPYKAEQYRRFALAVQLLRDGEHKTLAGGLQLLDLTYAMSSNSIQLYPTLKGRKPKKN